MVLSEVFEDLRASLWASIGALCLAAVGPMTCYMTYFLGLPLGVWGCWKSWQTAQRAAPGSNEHALAQIGLVGAGLATIMSGFFVFTMVIVVGVYGLMFILMGLVAIAGG